MLAAGGVLALAAIAAFTLWPKGGGATPRDNDRAGGSPTAKVAAPAVIRPVSDSGFDPLTSAKKDPGNEDSQEAKYAIDGNPKTAWHSQYYYTARFGDLKAGSGLIVNMGKSIRYSTVTVTFDSMPGADVELYIGNSGQRSKANFESMTKIASATSPVGKYTFHITSKAAGQYLVIWFTKLPPEPGAKGKYQAQIYNVAVQGTAP